MKAIFYLFGFCKSLKTLNSLLIFCICLIFVWQTSFFNLKTLAQNESFTGEGIFISEIHYSSSGSRYNNQCGSLKTNACGNDKWFEITNLSDTQINLNQLAFSKNKYEKPNSSDLIIFNFDSIIMPTKSVLISNLSQGILQTSDQTFFQQKLVNTLSKLNGNRYEVNLNLYFTPDNSSNLIKNDYRLIDSKNFTDLEIQNNNKKSLEFCLQSTSYLLSNSQFTALEGYQFSGTPGSLNPACTTSLIQSPKSSQSPAKNTEVIKAPSTSTENLNNSKNYQSQPSNDPTKSVNDSSTPPINQNLNIPALNSTIPSVLETNPSQIPTSSISNTNSNLSDSAYNSVSTNSNTSQTINNNQSLNSLNTNQNFFVESKLYSQNDLETLTTNSSLTTQLKKTNSNEFYSQSNSFKTNEGSNSSNRNPIFGNSLSSKFLLNQRNQSSWSLDLNNKENLDTSMYTKTFSAYQLWQLLGLLIVSSFSQKKFTTILKSTKFSKFSTKMELFKI